MISSWLLKTSLIPPPPHPKFLPFINCFSSRHSDSGAVVAIKCLNNYDNASSFVLRTTHSEEYTFPLSHPHWALPTIFNAWRGAMSGGRRAVVAP